MTGGQSCSNDIHLIIRNEELMKSLMDQGDEDLSSRGGHDTPLSSPPSSPLLPSGDLDESTQGSSTSCLAPMAGGQWPSMQDLNTRLRRLITSYQRNYKKEELRFQQRQRVCI